MKGGQKESENYQRAVSRKTGRTSNKAATTTAGAAREAEAATKTGAAQRSTTTQTGASKTKATTAAATTTKEEATYEHTDGDGQNAFTSGIIHKEKQRGRIGRRAIAKALWP